MVTDLRKPFGAISKDLKIEVNDRR